MSSNGTTLMHITTCRICGQSFSAPPMEVPIIGEPPATKTLRMIQYLQKHVEKKHPRHYATVIGSCNEFGVLLVGLSFDTTDPALLQSREALRYENPLFNAQNDSERCPNRTTDSRRGRADGNHRGGFDARSARR